MIKYSILIITYNQKEILARTLKSLSSQIKNPQIFEIVIADDFSTDGTDEFVKKQRLRIFMKYIKSDKNVGRSIIRNMGFEKTSGEQVIFLDGDMEPARDMIDAYLSSWESFPEAVIVGNWKQPPGFEYDRSMEFILSRGRFRRKSGGPIKGAYFNSGNFSIRRETFEKMSGFDLAFEGWKGEDTDFGIRLENASIPILQNPDAVAYHYHSKSLKEMVAEYERFGRSSYKVLARKHKPSRVFEKGWLLGLPDPTAGVGKQALSLLLAPLISKPVIAVLKKAASAFGGKLPFISCYSWLLYGCMAQSFKRTR